MRFERSIYKFWEKKIKIQPLGPPKRESLAGDFLGEISKEECSEKIRKGPTTNVVDTTLVLLLKAVNGGNQ